MINPFQPKNLPALADARHPQSARVNSAASVARSNAIWNESAFTTYKDQIERWQLNNGARWVGKVFVVAPMPPAPVYKETDFYAIFERMVKGEPDMTLVPGYMLDQPAADMNKPVYEYFEGGSFMLKGYEAA